jgi:RNA polymerase sigma-70 factor (ECF subfamily)
MAVDVEQYYRRYGPMVMRRCRNLLRDEEAAADAMHDTFVQVLRYRERLRDQAPSSLLYRIATNVCLNRIRAARGDLSYPAGDALEYFAGEDERLDAVVARDVVDRLLERQKPGTREIAERHYVGGMTLEETAKASGMSVSGVRKRLHRLRAHARETVVSS